MRRNPKCIDAKKRFHNDLPHHRVGHDARDRSLSGGCGQHNFQNFDAKKYHLYCSTFIDILTASKAECSINVLCKLTWLPPGCRILVSGITQRCELCWSTTIRSPWQWRKFSEFIHSAVWGLWSAANSCGSKVSKCNSKPMAAANFH